MELLKKKLFFLFPIENRWEKVRGGWGGGDMNNKMGFILFILTFKFKKLFFSFIKKITRIYGGTMLFSLYRLTFIIF